jgi:hypothetical protein
MRTSTQLDHDPCRVLLYRSDASELLLESTADGLELLVVPLPRFTRVAEELTAGIKDRWNLDTCCLFPVLEGISSSVSIPFHVVELSSCEAETPPAMQWLAATSLSAADFRDHDDFVAVRASLVRLEGFRRGELPGAFGKPGWLRTVTEWVAARAASVGLSLTGKFRQLNASATFSLLRFETDGPALWFKAVGEPNLREFQVTPELSRLFPAFVPRVIAVRAECNGWLAIEAEGTHPDEHSSTDLWSRVAAALAQMQTASLEQSLHLIEACCRDARVSTLIKLVDPFFELMAELMTQQLKHPPAALTPAELVSVAAQLRGILSANVNLKIRNAIGHLDFNAGNIVVASNRVIFLDWAEACVGFPFLTFQYLLEYLRRMRNFDHA